MIYPTSYWQQNTITQEFPGHGVIETDKVFSLADRADLDKIVERYAPKGVRIYDNDVQSLRRNIMNDTRGKLTIFRRWLSQHEMPTEADVKALTKLRDKAFKAELAEMDQDQYDDIKHQLKYGHMDEKTADAHITQGQRRALDDAFRTAQDLIFAISGLSSTIDHYKLSEVFMSDAEKAQARAEFAEYDKWEATKQAFRDRYDALDSIQSKAELRAMFPELADAAL